MTTYPIKCQVRAEGGSTRVDVYDDIGGGGWLSQGLTASDFTAQLSGVSGPLDVHINSGGGSVKDGTAIASAIRDYKGPTRTIVDGMAASIASVIMQAGQQRIIQPGAMVMVHDASSECYGNAADMAKMAADLNKHSDNLASIYAARAGGTVESWRDIMRAETWYTADEAVQSGLADQVGSSSAALPTGLDLAAYHGIPDRIVASLRTLPRRDLRAAYAPQPYKRESWENVLCPVCGCYNDDDGKYCGQCGIELAGRDDVSRERAVADDDDGDGMTDAAPTLPTASAGTDYLRRMAAEQRKGAEDGAPLRDVVQALVDAYSLEEILDAAYKPGRVQEMRDAASIDESDWDGPKAMSMAAKSDDPAATYKQICAGRRAGDPSKQDSWALPYKYPGKGPNAAGVRNALSRLPQTDDLTNKAEAQALLERLMRQINPDYDGGDADNAAPAWFQNLTAPDMPAWMNSAKEAK